MQSKVNIGTNQKVTATDFNNFGEFPRASMDNLVRDLGGFPVPRYTGLAVVQNDASSVLVGDGRFYKDGAVYGFTGPATIDMLSVLPSVAKKIVAIVAWGTTDDTALQPRTFLTDAATRATEGREVATESRRTTHVDKVAGVENATPVEPTVAADFVTVALVVLTPAGIESVTQLTANRLISAYANSVALTTINARLGLVGPQIDTLKTDVSALAMGLAGKADRDLAISLAQELALVKDRLDLPDDYLVFAADLFLTTDESDTGHGSYSARVSDGVRFPPAGSVTDTLALLNSIEPKVVVNDNMALPSYTSVVRASFVGKDSEYPLTNTSVESFDMRLVKETRLLCRHHGHGKAGTPSRHWLDGRFDPAEWLMKRTGETLAGLDTLRSLQPSRTVKAGRYHDHRHHAHGRWSVHEVTQTHWERVATTTSIAGSVTAFTKLNSQDGYLTGVDLYFSKKANAGDVRVLITDVDQLGQPVLDAVFADVTITQASIQLYPTATLAGFKPVFMPKGSRFGVVLLSSASHFICRIAGNQDAQAVTWNLVNSAWVQADATIDIAHQLRFALFDAARVTVQLESFELTDGIDSLDINADKSLPSGTSLEFSVRVDNEWVPLSSADDDVNVFADLPSLVQVQVTYAGTQDVMPALGLGARSEVKLYRPGTAFTHWSTARVMPSAVSTIVVRQRFENWDNAQHTCVVTLDTGAGYATPETADATVDTVPPDDPDALIRESTFNVTAVSQFKIKNVGGSGSSAERFHIASRTDIEFA